MDGDGGVLILSRVDRVEKYSLVVAVPNLLFLCWALITYTIFFWKLVDFTVLVDLFKTKSFPEHVSLYLVDRGDIFVEPVA